MGNQKRFVFAVPAAGARQLGRRGRGLFGSGCGGGGPSAGLDTRPRGGERGRLQLNSSNRRQQLWRGQRQASKPQFQEEERQGGFRADVSGGRGGSIVEGRRPTRER